MVDQSRKIAFSARRSLKVTLLASLLILGASGCTSDHTSGGSTFADSQGNTLTEEQMKARETLISICTTADDADYVRSVWDAVDYSQNHSGTPISFDTALLGTLDGSADKSAQPSLVLVQPEEIIHLSQTVNHCATIVSLLPQLGEPEKMDVLAVELEYLEPNDTDFTSFLKTSELILSGIEF